MKQTIDKNNFSKVLDSLFSNKKYKESWKHSSSSLFGDKPDFAEISLLRNKSKTFDKDLNNQNYIYANIANLLEDFNSDQSQSGLSIKVLEDSKAVSQLNDFNDDLRNFTIQKAEKKITINITKSLNKTIFIDFDFDFDFDLDDNDNDKNKATKEKQSLFLPININVNLSKDCKASIFVSNDAQNIANWNFNLNTNSSLDHFLAIKSNTKCINYDQFNLEQNSTLNTFTLIQGGSFIRINQEINLNNKGASVSSNGIFKCSGNNHVDILTKINHNSPFTTSQQLFKGISKDNSRGIFNGKVTIERDAINSSSNQLSKNIVHDKSKIFSRPQLEVYNDDVSCTHGATFGQMSEEEKFYLVSRGIDLQTAEKLLESAFYQEVINNISCQNFKDHASDLIFNSSSSSRSNSKNNTKLNENISI